MRWQCLATGHDPAVYDSAAEFTRHMQEAHAGAFPADELPFLAEISQHPLSPTVSSCPFCPELPATTSPKNREGLEEHVAQHLQELAIFSMDPPCSDPPCSNPPSSEPDCTETSDGGGAKTRSTVWNFREEWTEPVRFFEDDIDVETDEAQGPEPATRLHEWGAIIAAADQHAMVDTAVLLHGHYQHLAAFACEQFKKSDAAALVEYLSAPGIDDFLVTFYFVDIVYSFLRVTYGVFDERLGIGRRSLVQAAEDLIQELDRTAGISAFTEKVSPSPFADAVLSIETRCRDLASCLLGAVGDTDNDDDLINIRDLCVGQDTTKLVWDLSLVGLMEHPLEETYR